ncbi:MAG TPA: transketolase [Acidimicrobiales bacterium]|nr:transketolase [Acidimicrobiales bacterium]
MTDLDLDQCAVAVLRGLAMDAPHAARSGHQGTAMALAPLAHVLWSRILRFDPNDTEWADRDRFVLSAGHASILLYSMIHLTGQGLTLDDLRAFRQWESRTPGHPEAGADIPGVEVTTGPLGQGVANAVGMAVAERALRARFGAEVCDHHVFAICGDGDLSEGISHESASLAGHLGLGRLVMVYDDNRITIDGPTDLALSDDVVGRFRAYGWHVEELGEVGDDLDALEAGLRAGMAEADRPTLLVLRTHVATPSPLTDHHSAHGYALFDDEIATTKELLGLPVDATFHVPDEARRAYDDARERGAAARAAWDQRLAALDPEPRARWDVAWAGSATPGWEDALPSWAPGSSPTATRKASGACLAALAPHLPGLVAGSADLTGNTGLDLGDADAQSAAHPGGTQLYYGVREHAMGAMMTGMARHGGVLPVGGTFFVFSDYMRPAVRLAAMSQAKVVYSWTHDSVGVGEDGPTHQPVEHLASLRAMPELRLIRPADANETVAAWRVALTSAGPTALVLSRQDVPVLDGTDPEGVARGGYVLADPDGDPDLVLIGTGSEVAVCVQAAADLSADGVATRVVSLPSWDLFAAQDRSYRDRVLPPGTPRVSVEAGSTFGWERWADAAVGIDRFGASAPASVALDRLGINPGHVAATARQLLATTSRRTS